MSFIPELKYSAALIGEGSGVLGFDTERSTDHDWGPRILLFVPKSEDAGKITSQLDTSLPSVLRRRFISGTAHASGLAHVASAKAPFAHERARLL